MPSGGPAGLSIPGTRFERLVLLGVIVATGCSPARDEPATARIAQDSIRADSIARARQDAINRTLPGYVVDSILPVEEELRRFRLAVREQGASSGSGTSDSVTALTSGSRSREALVRRFIKALVTNDSSDLRAMRLAAREFADLVYPESPYTRPPYRQSPALVWNQIRNPSASGLTRLLRRLGGQPLRYVNHSCARNPERQGGNLIWTDCTVVLMDSSSETARHRLFGSIIERDGRLKFVSYSNEF
ncbi:MAG TPA: hypothetical protein VES88_12705 [Gemmatimonadaceae bacterium]|nr:hypothetical protein [Gemmatimonadaceae bacterium]